MLQLNHIRKEYHVGTFTQKALDDVSLSLRDNEFVAVLGPSGSGKTTLLNIIGGLDRYDSGDLIINDISTKKYKDRDWDSYRNHTIGFVFQSYNLIPHQSVIANVELALTIGGISGAEKRRRATDALTKVGLAEHMHKRPNQLSGGQMQRVAIARALVNDPDILLADEPTGALDSETSIQVMELLKEVASDRLVVMVTHNPELAERYATRIVELKDGRIISDSDPFVPDRETPAVHKNLGKAAMSFFTSLALSFNNLKSKLTRTILIAFAGSIGIIGIALIMALSNGVNQYIKDTEEETLKEYPLSITSMSLDLEGMMESRSNRQETDPDISEAEVREMQMITTLFSTFSRNDLASLRVYLEEKKDSLQPLASAVEYRYSVSPLIYVNDKGTYRQVNPDTLLASLGYQTSGGLSSMFSSYSNTDVFSAMPANEQLYQSQYDVKAGHWPEAWNECVLVLMSNGGVSDIALYDMNMKDQTELYSLIAPFIAGDKVEITGPRGRYKYTDFLGLQFSLVNRSDCYQYDETYKVWTLKTDDTAYMQSLIAKGETLEIVGVVQPKEDASIAMLSPGICYPAELTYHCMEMAAGSQIVKAQLKDDATDVITGKAFGASERLSLDMKDLFSVDEEAMKNAFSFDTESMDLDMEDLFSDMDLSEMFADFDITDMDLSQMDLSDLDLSGLDLSSLDFSGVDVEIPNLDLASLMSGITIRMTTQDMTSLFRDLLREYQIYINTDPSINWTLLPEALTSYLSDEKTRETLSDDISAIIAHVGAAAITEEELQGFAAQIIAGYEAWADKKGLDADERDAASIQEYLETDEASKLLRDVAEQLISRLSEAAIPREDLDQMMNTLLEGYDAYAKENSLPELSKFESSLNVFFASQDIQNMIRGRMASMVDMSGAQAEIQKTVENFTTTLSQTITEAMTQAITQAVTAAVTETAKQTAQIMTEAFTTQLSETVPGMMEEMMQKIGESFRFDGDVFADAVSMNFTEDELMELMTSLFSTETTTLNTNLQKFGYVSMEDPEEIDIYPLDFESKGKIKDLLTAYNDSMEEKGEEDKKIIYTDLVGVMMSSVTNIVNAISYVLIAFVAISLIVSSIMIGVITYISVLERKKEIGILRALGASKRNISQVFNAETIIIGFLAGLLGVVISELLLIPANIILKHVTGQNIAAVLPLLSGAALIILSIFLTLLGGLLPSNKAARQDPVEALRTE